MEKNFTKMLREEIKVAVYALMQGLSSAFVKPLLLENIGLIKDLAAFMDATEDEEWAEDWASWCDAVNAE